LHAEEALKINNFLFELNLIFFSNFLIVALPPIAFSCPLKYLQNLGFQCENEKESDFPILRVFLFQCTHIANKLSPANKNRRK
jgi:hypothetical protein